MAIHCGHCREAHATVAQVRACAQTPYIPKGIRRTFTEQDERDMQRMEMEGDRADTIQDEAAKAAWKDSVETLDHNGMIARVKELLATKVEPKEEWRWSRAVRRMISGNSGVITAYALRTAIARLEAYADIPNVPAAAVAAPPATQEGLYRLNGRLYQVLRGRDSMRLYAKLVTFNQNSSEGKRVRPTLTYARGIIYDLTMDHLVPIEEAQEITRKTGWCIFGHFLTNPKSIARGMGDTCYARYPHLARNAV